MMLFLIPFNVDGNFMLDIYGCHTEVKTNKMSMKPVNHLVNWSVIDIVAHVKKT